MATGIITRRGGSVENVETAPTAFAFGGDIYEFNDGVDDWRAHEFTENGTFVVTEPGEMEYLIVAGGGSGTLGSSRSSDGAGGGVIGQFTYPNGTKTLSPLVTEIPEGSYTVVVGQQPTNSNQQGPNSSFLGQTAIGGGKGDHDSPAGDGGSGGGASPSGYGGSPNSPGQAVGGDNLGNDGGTTTGSFYPGGSGSVMAAGGTGSSSGSGSNGPGAEIELSGRTLFVGGVGRADNRNDRFGYGHRAYYYASHSGIVIIRYKV